MENQETLTDICEELRSGEYAPLADRIEAARKREDGNAAALREALANLVDVIDRYDSGSPLWWHCGAKGVKPLKDAKAALSAPPRVCDVNTLGSLSYFVEKAILTSDLLKDTHEIVKRIVVLLTSLPRGNESKGRRCPCIS